MKVVPVLLVVMVARIEWCHEAQGAFVARNSMDDHRHLPGMLNSLIDDGNASDREGGPLDEITVKPPITRITYASTDWTMPTSAVLTPVLNGVIVAPGGLVYNSSSDYALGRWYWKYYWNGNPIWKTKGGNNQAQLRKVQRPWVETEASPCVTFVVTWANQFQHAVFDTLPKLSFGACDLLARTPDMVVLAMSEVQKELIQTACPVAKERRFRLLTRTLRAPVIWIPHFEPNPDFGISPPQLTRSLGSQSAPGTEAVYIPRHQGAVRSVGNEAEVLAALRQTYPNLRVLLPSDWKTDRAVLSSAAIVIGPHGGGLANMIFAPVNTTVIEFTPLVRLKQKGGGLNERPCYFGLANALGFRYHALEPETFDFDKGPMVMPAAALEKDALAKLLAGDGTAYHAK